MEYDARYKNLLFASENDHGDIYETESDKATAENVSRFKSHAGQTLWKKLNKKNTLWSFIIVLMLATTCLLASTIFLSLNYKKVSQLLMKETQTNEELISNYSKMPKVEPKFKSGYFVTSDIGRVCVLDSLSLTKWKLFNMSMYFFSTTPQPWKSSRQYCQQMDADLVVINNKEEQDFLKDNSRTNYWIGLTDEGEEGAWHWADGTPHNISTGFWCKDEPNDAKGDNHMGEDCAALWTRPPCQLEWNDENCLRSFNFICEKQIKCNSP
ncbi:hepatic lectin-like [Protopterus annectens]|uniref:hepatic lectin-like n=1 Tax=Protopterus annectens TaxID=7888 RepID=UPI001CFB82EC|nr:hepatic lectin-like [Protopterus annectens]